MVRHFFSICRIEKPVCSGLLNDRRLFISQLALVMLFLTSCGNKPQQSAPIADTAVTKEQPAPPAPSTDSTLYGIEGEDGMSTFTIITNAGDTINLTRTSINGTDGQLSGEKNQGDSFAVTTTDHGQALRTAINLTQLKQFTKRYRIHNGHLYLPTPRGKYERVNIDWLDSDSLVVSSPKGRHHFDPQNVKDLNAGKIK